MGIIIIITKAMEEMEDMNPELLGTLVDLLHQSWPMGLVQHTEDMIGMQRAFLTDEKSVRMSSKESIHDLVAESVRMSSEESMADLVAESVRISSEASMADLVAESLEMEVQIMFEGLINSKGWTV